MISAVIPCFRCKNQIADVLKRCFEQAIDRVYLIDDACPENTGAFVTAQFAAEITAGRLKVLTHSVNQGVGGAMVTGYKQALADGAEVILKIDGDGQMDPALCQDFIKPLLTGRADYAKGNRFVTPRSLQGMPLLRLIGNSLLSFVSKLATGYWNVMDPNNGYTAIHAQALSLIDLDAIDKTYFFETDMLFRLGIARAVVVDVPMKAVYADETSSLKIGRILFAFPPRYARIFFKRLVYLYLVRDFNLGSVQALAGAALLSFGALFGGYHWYLSSTTGMPATSGTVMLSAMPVILGFQLFLAAISFDVSNVPTTPIQSKR